MLGFSNEFLKLILDRRGLGGQLQVGGNRGSVDDAFDVRCTLYMGDLQCLLLPFNRVSLLSSRWVSTILKFIYSEKATKLNQIFFFTLLTARILFRNCPF